MTSSEREPLLAADQPRERNEKRSGVTTLCLVFLINFLLYTGQLIALAPRMQIYESIVCHNHLSTDSSNGTKLAGDPCKSEDVQSQLAFVLGIEEFLTVFMSILCIPYSFVAERYGWYPVLSLSIFGVVLEVTWPLVVCIFPQQLSLYWVWLAVAFEAIGGGLSVTVTMLNLILLSLVTQESRTRVFLYLSASSLLATFTGQVIASLMMRSSVWVPAWIGSAFHLVALAFSISLYWAGPRHSSQAPRDTGEHSGQTVSKRNAITTLGTKILGMLQSMGATVAETPQVAIVMFAAFTFPLGEDSMFTVILLYISKRYGWTIGDANSLVASSAIIRLFTLLVWVPGLSYLLVRYGGATSYSRDRYLVQIEGILLLAGAVCTALAPTVVLAFGGITLMSLGMAIVTVLRSLVTDMVPHQHVTLIYSMMTMMMRIGSGVAGPVFAWSFGLGMRLGSGWTGLPFLISAILFLAGTIALAFISRSPQKEKSTVDNEELYA